MSLTAEEQIRYSAIIDGILASSDLSTIGATQVRKNLQAALGHDISDKKIAVKELILLRFDHVSSQQGFVPPAEEPVPSKSPRPTTNGHQQHTVKKERESIVKHESPAFPVPPSPSKKHKDEDVSDDGEIILPAKKKRKPNGSSEIDDAKYAAMLQAQENSRARPTRAGAVPKKKVVLKKKKVLRKKSEKKVGKDDDSDMEEVGSDGQVREKVKKGGFHKKYSLSAPLAELVGEPTLSRPQVVKKIWAHIKANNLQDPSDKRQIMCDEKMQSVFKTEKVQMFTMNKLLGKQLYDVEEE